ncbi:probable WRKY transcription factor 26 [Aristolochia californica]|uniref:probable WRKY transcription factor 26 n=1 Tax=Aristolochia californica TaxID=171875 RepID=UPI0035DF8D48
MASSTESLETSANSHQPFSFTTSAFMSAFSADHNDSRTISSGRAFSDRVAERVGAGVPKFKSLPPPSLPISPPSPFSSSYFSIPAGLSPAELLDSPVLLSTSNILPSPTTGSFPTLSFNWKGNFSNYQQNIKEEQKSYSDFSFQPQAKPINAQSSIFQTSSAATPMEEPLKGQQQLWSYQESSKQSDFSAAKNNIKAEYASAEISNIQTNNGFQSDFNQVPQAPQSYREQRRSEDGYNWRKYGQKQVKGSENPRSYYKCTFPNCPTKKKVERSLDGQITEIVYKGSHNHPKPQSTKRNSSSAAQPVQAAVTSELSDHSFAGRSPLQMESVATPENSSLSIGDDDIDQSSQRSKSGGDEFDEDEPDIKRWKKDNENEGLSAAGSRTVREPRVVVQTTSDIDILDDGYRWRKYGQKVVKGNPNPRSYYKCTYVGCPVRKHVERASHDHRAVITTYEGKHNHDVPAARGSGSQAVNRPPPPPPPENNNLGLLIKPSVTTNHSNPMMGNPEGQTPFTLEMLQSPTSYGYSAYSDGPYMAAPSETENTFSKTKEEPRDDLFLEQLLY